MVCKWSETHFFSHFLQGSSQTPQMTSKHATDVHPKKWRPFFPRDTAANVAPWLHANLRAYLVWTEDVKEGGSVFPLPTYQLMDTIGGCCWSWCSCTLTATFFFVGVHVWPLDGAFRKFQVEHIFVIFCFLIHKPSSRFVTSQPP